VVVSSWTTIQPWVMGNYQSYSNDGYVSIRTLIDILLLDQNGDDIYDNRVPYVYQTWRVNLETPHGNTSAVVVVVVMMMMVVVVVSTMNNGWVYSRTVRRLVDGNHGHCHYVRESSLWLSQFPYWDDSIVVVVVVVVVVAARVDVVRVVYADKNDTMTPTSKPSIFDFVVDILAQYHENHPTL
jgi:hypothetical protein